MLHVIYCRIFDEALVKSVLIKTYPDKSVPTGQGEYAYPTMSQMHEVQFTTYKKYPIVGINQNVGSTSHYDRRLADKQDYSFGVAHYFFRFNFTSAVYEKAYAHVNWIKFTAVKFHSTTFIGHMTGDEFYNGPRNDPNISPYVFLDDLIPSRFAMMFEKPHPVGFTVAFISMDPERVNETTNDGLFMDLGDNFLSSDLKIADLALSDEMEKFLTTSTL